MIIDTIKTTDGKLVTQFFPENDEDRAELDRMSKDGELEQIDGFQADVPPDDTDI